MKKYAILTGDLVNSRMLDSQIWLRILEDSLTKFSKKFDIFRGDSFQAEVELDKCLLAIFYIKARVKAISNLDVRIGVGIGTLDYDHNHIKNSTGESLIYSGEAFDSLQKELISLKSFNKDWDRMANIMLSIAIELANKWSTNMAETVAACIEYPKYNQHELASLLNRKYQSQVSTELGKSNWSKIEMAIEYCQNELLKIC